MYAKMNIDKQFIQAIYNSINNKINQFIWEQKKKSVQNFKAFTYCTLY